MGSTFSMPMAYWLAAGVLAIVSIYKLYSLGMRTNDYPPGPPTVPVVGNLLQMPLKDSHLHFGEWARKYGGIVGVKFGGQNVVFLNDRATVKELAEKRSAIYSCRPDIYFRVFSDNNNMVLRDNDDVWRRARKMYHLRLNSRVSDTYVPYQEFDSLQLLNELMTDPDNFSQHLGRYTTSVASTVIYGVRTTEGSRYTADLKKWMKLAVEAQNLQIVDLYTFLRPLYALIPTRLDPYKRLLQDIADIELPTFMAFLDMAKANIASGKVYPSFISDMLSSKERDGMTDEEIARNAGHGVAAAADTQWGTARGFIKAMVLFPDVLAKAQHEIDTVVGPNRLPTWADRADLPYMRAVIEETYRWAPMGFTAVPHATARDDVYNGYKIAKGSLIMVNTYHLNHSGALITGDPREFDPSRFTDEETLIEMNSVSAESTTRKHFTFGTGRRVCPGFHVAQRGLFVALSRMVWGFSFGKKLDARGNEIPIDRDAFDNQLAAQVAEFQCEIKPRDEKRAEIMKREWDAAQVHLDDDGNFTREFFEKVFESKRK